MPNPHILLFTGDHVRPDVLAAADAGRQTRSLASAIVTPHLDALAADGVAFRQCHSLNPICVPSRAALTTGCYPHKCTGVKKNGGTIRPGHAKLAEHFHAHGYRTAAVGKLHYLPYSPSGTPRLLHGFEHAELCEEGRILGEFDPTGETPGLEDYHDFLAASGWAGYERSHGIGNNDIHPGSVPFPAEFHEEAWVAQGAVRAIEGWKADAPSFLWASFAKPHPPYDPPAPYDRMYDPREMPAPLGVDSEEIMADRDPELRARRIRFGWNLLSAEAVQVARAHYAGLMSFQDAMIGRIIAALKERGLYDQTIIVYTADHGDLLGDFGRFFKSCMFDASVKVPLVVRAPQLTAQRGGYRDHLVGLHDLFPTLAALAQIPLPADVDGTDLTTILQTPAAPGRDQIVAQCLDDPQQKYLLRTARWKYVYHQQGGVEELYDAERTDYELTNLAGQADHREILDELRKSLIAWCVEHGDLAMLDAAGGLKTSPLPATPPAFAVQELGWRPY